MGLFTFSIIPIGHQWPHGALGELKSLVGQLPVKVAKLSYFEGCTPEITLAMYLNDRININYSI